MIAFIGGALLCAGAQVARGCTSGAVLSGMAVLSTDGFVAMMAIFGTGYAFAWFERAAAYESSLMGYALRALGNMKGVRLIGNPRHRAGSISLVVEGIETEAIGKFLDRQGIAVRSGHHCAQPSLARFGLQTSVRPSLAFYNTVGEINRLVEAILKAQYELK